MENALILVSFSLMDSPGTAELSMRFGLHSGPVTAGVLRGAKSRFQLFGDTVNTGKYTPHLSFQCTLNLTMIRKALNFIP